MIPARLVTFDFYTALVDYESSLLPAVRQVCEPSADPVQLLRAWRAKQLEGALLSNSLQRGRVPFRELTRRALIYTFAKAGHSLSKTCVDDLVSAWDGLSPWPEANSTLADLRARGYVLGLLSNGDETMLRAGMRCFDVMFDHVLASDHAGVYKPHPAIYALPLERLGVAREQVLHVAGSANDVAGAKLAGLHCAWSNRNGEPMLQPDVKADYEMRSLADLLRVLE